MLPKSLSTIILTILCCLPATFASAQTCIHCPVESTASAVGVAFSIFAIQDGQTNNVSGGTVGACNQLLLVANLSYNPNAIDAQGNPAVGAGFTAGSAHIILPNGSGVDVTPADMGTTLVSSVGINACTPPGGTTMTSVKNMNPGSYTLTAADIAVGVNYSDSSDRRRPPVGRREG